MRKLSTVLPAKQSGFTLIELVIVIVIIGILAAVAIPQFANLSDDARRTHSDAVAGAVAQQAGFQNIKCNQLANDPSCTGDNANGTRACGFYTPRLPVTGVNGATLTCSFVSTTATTACQVRCTDGTHSIDSNITFNP